MDWKPSKKYDAWPGCIECKFYNSDLTCDAYPESIPLLIASGQTDHMIKRPDQTGNIVFEPKEENEEKE